MRSKIFYVVINLLSSLFIFFRSAIFLKVLPDEELGNIMLFQAIISLMGFGQIGIFNGGLRFFSLDSNSEYYREVNNNNFSYIGIFIATSCIFFLFTEGHNYLMLLAIGIGGISMLKNWSNNILVARQKFKTINIINLITSLLSTLISLSVFHLGVKGAIAGISSMHILYIILFFILNKDYIPNKFQINKKIFKILLSYGFVPYLSGLINLVNNQVDKILIADLLSLKALGQFYLAYTFKAIFDLFPNNLNSLFTPKAINAYSLRDIKSSIYITKTYFIIIFIYILLAGFAIFFLSYEVINLLMPEKISQLKILYIMIPGIFALTLVKPFNFLLYISFHLKAIFWSAVIALVIYFSLLVLLIVFQDFSIVNIAWAKSIQGIFVLLFIATVVTLHWKKISNFYFLKEDSIRK